MKTTIVARRYSEKDSRIIACELKKIQQESSVITPKLVVLAAEDEANPLHKYFEWNNTKAAERYREWQARSLIISVYLVDSDDEGAAPVRAFVNLKPDQDDEFIPDQGYVFTPSIASKANYQAQVLDYAKAQLLAWRNKFGAYREFFGIVKEIDRVTKA